SSSAICCEPRRLGLQRKSVESPIGHGGEHRRGARDRSTFGCTMARPVRRLGNLPAEATSFVGRRRELAELRKKLGAVRIVSLVGPGGVGKTRLAIRAATDLARAFPA